VKHDYRCPKCGGEKIMRLDFVGDAGDWTGYGDGTPDKRAGAHHVPRRVLIEKRTSVGLFGGKSESYEATGETEAYVCVACGYLEEYLAKPASIRWDAVSGAMPWEKPAHVDPLAAVAAVVRDGPHGAEVLLIKRADRAGDPWSGQMAFPGGRRDPRDAHLLETARRETLEEVGLDLDRHGRLLGPLPDTPTHKNQIVVRPYVFAVTGDPVLVPNAEVARVLWTPLAPLVRGEAASSYTFEHDGQKWTLPAYRVEDQFVWGLTYRFLEALFEEIAEVTGRERT
jgi:8-oxo-dGTP pyrophosphatase MutT (NUDIX family)